jgi:C4-type Zn-finger protein
MIRYLARSCPRCSGYVGITIRESGLNVPVKAVNGRCSRCTFRMAWIVIRGAMEDPRQWQRKLIDNETNS